MNGHMIRLAAVIFAMTFFLTGCGAFSRSPAQTVEDFYKAVGNGEIDDAMGMLTNQAISSAGPDKVKSG
ncbi:MAG: hypothetical protein KDE47_25265, partial [Caldilineaceae bacterium]|nr:hypothetical protein [Caldilineaceae bacterium]